MIDSQPARDNEEARGPARLIYPESIIQPVTLPDFTSARVFFSLIVVLSLSPHLCNKWPCPLLQSAGNTHREQQASYSVAGHWGAQLDSFFLKNVWRWEKTCEDIQHLSLSDSHPPGRTEESSPREGVYLWGQTVILHLLQKWRN